MPKIFLNDARNATKLIGEKSVDLIITASPYLKNDLDYKNLNIDCFAEAFKILKDDRFFVSITQDVKKLRTTPRHLIIYQSAIKAGFTPYEHKIWHRQESLNIFRKTFAHIWIFAKGNPKILEKIKDDQNDVWLIKSNMKVEDYNQAFAPELPERFIRAMTKKGDTVADIFCGSGTTLKEAEKLNRQAIGIEIDQTLKRFYPDSWEINFIL